MQCICVCLDKCPGLSKLPMHMERRLFEVLEHRKKARFWSGWTHLAHILLRSDIKRLGSTSSCLECEGHVWQGCWDCAAVNEFAVCSKSRGVSNHCTCTSSNDFRTLQTNVWAMLLNIARLLLTIWMSPLLRKPLVILITIRPLILLSLELCLWWFETVLTFCR